MHSIVFIFATVHVQPSVQEDSIRGNPTVFHFNFTQLYFPKRERKGGEKEREREKEKERERRLECASSEQLETRAEQEHSAACPVPSKGKLWSPT